ncbi:phytoene/squalene synthase family protein [Rossellomorea aquimaris]|uniref:phytoene/squalene synthase family protein n=1 Tax=Rossellomorea aquimaris TaxID=189382 RepID=UPI001CD4D095|nr:phytoene/squalene synthase family protein [Rossellomorea aquimaris]MCA1054980.1 phytoene/squalene synthase family protein [Rossellomorea aquimaris]
MYSVSEAYKQCENVISHHSKTFYKAFSLLPKHERNAVWAVYSFCRKVDDIVDEGNNPEAELAEFKAEFELFLEGRFDHTNPSWIALHDVFNRYEMDTEAFHGLIKGQEMDLTINRYETLEELLDYSYHVASTVGLMLLPILAPGKTGVLREGAISLGLAMQLTNILRDISEDLERNRIYLPRQLMERHGVTEATLSAGIVDASFVELWEEIAGHAESHYRESFKTMNEYPLSSRIPVKSAAYLYREILPTIRSKKHRVFGQKHYVDDAAKKEILVELSSL